MHTRRSRIVKVKLHQIELFPSHRKIGHLSLYHTGVLAAPRLIHAPVIEEPADVQAEAGAGGAEERASRSWYLALDGNWLHWIHTRGERSSDGDSISHMGRKLHSYSSVRCHIFKKDLFPFDDPLAGEDWIRPENLQGKCAFVGVNYPFFQDTSSTSEPAANANADEALPLMKPDCVFATHASARKRPQPRPDWI